MTTCDVDGIRLVSLAFHHPESDLQLVILSTCHPVIVTTSLHSLMIMPPCHPFCELPPYKLPSCWPSHRMSVTSTTRHSNHHVPVTARSRRRSRYLISVTSRSSVSHLITVTSWEEASGVLSVVQSSLSVPRRNQGSTLVRHLEGGRCTRALSLMSSRSYLE